MAEQKEEELQNFVWPPPFGLYWELLLKIGELEKSYECGLCHKLCRDVVEMVCAEHSNDEDEESDDDSPPKLQIFCQSCVEAYFAENGNLCPLTKHSNPKWQKNNAVSKAIARLKMRCPRTLQQKKR